MSSSIQYSGPQPPVEGLQRRTKAGQAVEVIKQRIKRGIYGPGEQFPSTRALADEFQLTRPTIQRAVKQLEVEGLLESQHGVGTRVRDTADCTGTPLVFGFLQPYFTRFSIALNEYIEDALDLRSNLCVIKSTRNDPVREREQIEKLVRSGVNGLLIWPVDGDTNGAYFQDVAKRLPVVFVDRTVEGVRAPAVVMAYRDLGRQIVRRLSKLGKGRLLTVCDPAHISTFIEMKAGMREEAERFPGKCTLTFLDPPLISAIESSYKGNFKLADACYEEVEACLKSQQFDAIFSPLGEFYDVVFTQGNRTAILDGLLRVSKDNAEGPPQWRSYNGVDGDTWTDGTAQMLLTALDLLQDMTLRRTNSVRTIRIPFKRAR